MASATANSGPTAISSSAYSPIQNDEAGKAVRRPARSWRKRRNSAASAYAESALKLSMTMIPGRRSLSSAVDLLEDAGEAALVEDRAEIVVEDGVADRFRVEEAERLAVAEDLVERLRHRREVEGGPLERRVREQVLLGEDRLAGSRKPDQQVDRVRREAAAEHAVEARHGRSRDARSSRRRALQEGARPEQVLDGRDELQRIERLPQEGVGAGCERLRRARRASRSPGRQALRLPSDAAQLGAGSAGDEQLDHGELGQELLELARCVIGIEGESDLVALGLEEELGELGRVRITLGEQDQKASACSLVIDLEAEAAVGARAARPAGGGPPPPAALDRFAP